MSGILKRSANEQQYSAFIGALLRTGFNSHDAHQVAGLRQIDLAPHDDHSALIFAEDRRERMLVAFIKAVLKRGQVWHTMDDITWCAGEIERLLQARMACGRGLPLGLVEFRNHVRWRAALDRMEAHRREQARLQAAQ